MKDDSIYFMTPFDQYISTQPLQMLKLWIPFLPPQSQRLIAIYVKFFEFTHTFSFFRNMQQKAFCAEDILNTLKPYMPASDIESFEQMWEMMSMMQEMQNMNGADFDPASMMMGMFTQDEPSNIQKEGETIVGMDE